MAGYFVEDARVEIIIIEVQMKILIVDDENGKASNIKNALITKNEILDKDITIVPSIYNAIEKLLLEKYDLMILDMCIPERYGDKLENDGGLKLLTTLNRDTRIIAPTEIIVLTAHSELIETYNTDVKAKSFDIIAYHDNSEEWKEKINHKVAYLKRYLESPKVKREYKYDIAILTAVACEKDAVMKLSDKWERIPLEYDSTIYYETIWRNENREISVVTTCLPQMGMVSATAIAMKLILNFIPRYVLLPGIAAGIKNEYEFGDIIIPREVKDYCSGKYITPEKEGIEEAQRNPLKYFIPTASSISTNTDVINSLSYSFKDELSSIHNIWPKSSEYKVPTIRTGYMATGDSVIQNNSVIDLLVKNHLRTADGLDMEAYGVYYAAQQSLEPKPISICFKAISDFADKYKKDDHQAYAAYISANFMKYYALNMLFR
jgi:nucleoside phosphorylase